MKIVWTLLLGMFIFQSLFVTLGVLDAFNLEEGKDVRLIGYENVSSNLTEYEDITLNKPIELFSKTISFGGGLWGNIATGLLAGITLIGIVGLIMLGKYVGAAIVMYMGFAAWLYGKTAGLLIHMNDIGGGSLVGIAFIGLFGVVLAILVIKSIIEMLAPGGVD